MVPRVRVPEIWRVPEPWLEQAQDDATLLAIRDMERAGIDIVTDGEIRRESYSNRFATALDGVDIDHPGDHHRACRQAGQGAADHRADPAPPPGRGARRRVPARATPSGRSRSPLPGPFTMSRQARNEFYGDDEEVALDFAAAVNEEAHDLKAAGADVIQIDEPWLETAPEVAARYALQAIDRALAGIAGPDRAAHVLRLRPAGAATRARAATRSWSRSPTARSTRSRSRRRSRSSISAC